MLQKQYDYIFTGAGCAGLSLLVRMLKSGHFNNKDFLLIDRDQKISNDRTWCFWETGKGFFEEIVYSQWERLQFYGKDFETTLDIAPYKYKMIRGIDFYEYCFNEISKHSNVKKLDGEIQGNYNDGKLTSINVGNLRLNIENTVVFNSVDSLAGVKKGSIQLLQHFKGWFIESGNEDFDPDKATLMDFRVHQDFGTTFVYVLPVTKNKALVEYTLFTKNLLKPEQYDHELKQYIESVLGVNNYRVTEEEFGIIPMTNQQFAFYNNGCYNIGKVGGQTKASSGYTFQFIQKRSEQILNAIIEGKELKNLKSYPARFDFYDNTLLEILDKGTLQGKDVFTDMFKKNPAQQVLKFLDNETTLIEELKLIKTLPTWEFMKAGIKNMKM